MRSTITSFVAVLLLAMISLAGITAGSAEAKSCGTIRRAYTDEYLSVNSWNSGLSCQSSRGLFRKYFEASANVGYRKVRYKGKTWTCYIRDGYTCWRGPDDDIKALNAH
jgi:hypothetical protein